MPAFVPLSRNTCIFAPRNEPAYATRQTFGGTRTVPLAGTGTGRHCAAHRYGERQAHRQALEGGGRRRCRGGD